MAVARYYNHTLGEWVLLAAGRDGESGASSWDDLTDKPATFPPETHTHTKEGITDLETISTQPTADHLVKRVVAGDIVVPFTPGFNNAAASKNYVESWTPSIQIVNSLPSTPEEGVVYLVREE